MKATNSRESGFKKSTSINIKTLSLQEVDAFTGCVRSEVDL